MIDRRLNVFRSDLADLSLRETVKASKYVSAKTFCVSANQLEMRRKPDLNLSIDTELLYGEKVDVFEKLKGWAWVKSQTDNYVGYVQSRWLTQNFSQQTHLVSALRTYVYPEPDLKQPPIKLLSINSFICVSEIEKNCFMQLCDGGWIWKQHISKIGNYETDHCHVALRFLGTPYRWGGRTSLGLDCSALVQLSLMRCGLKIPRDSDMQESSVGREVICQNDLSDLKYGDIIYWRGHCGIWVDKSNFIHASASDMAVTIGPLQRILQNITVSTGDQNPRVRRP